nr:unnamed protein product [Callosobruchus chinensis]
MDEVLRETRQTTKRLQIGYRNLKPVEISDCVFADDLAIFANSGADLQQNLNIWNTALKKRNMKINVNKSKKMTVTRQHKATHLQLEGSQLEDVETFRYLGTVIDSSGREEHNLSERISAAGKLYWALKDSCFGKKEVSIGTKLKVYKTIVIPVLLWGSESWVLTKSMKQKLQVMEMKFLRKIKGVTRTDRLKKEDIRNELGVEPVWSLIERNQLKWFGHMCRMDNSRQIRKVWECKTMPNRRRGRPTTSWNKAVQGVFEKKGLTMSARRMATDKKQWCEIVYCEK